MLKSEMTTATQKLGMHPCILTALWLGLTGIRYGTPYPDIIQEVLPPLCCPIQQ